MAKINQYPAKTVPSNNDEFVLHDTASGSTKKMTRGDLIGGAPLPANSVNGQAIADGSVTPAKRAGGLKVGIIPSSTFSTSGIKTISGLGFRPRLVKFTMLFTGTTGENRVAFGAMDETGSQYLVINADAGGSNLSGNQSQVACIGWGLAASTSFAMVAAYSSMNADGFSINVTNANGAFAAAYEAYA